MSVADALLQFFEDAYFRVVNVVDTTKRIAFDLASAASGKTVTIQSGHQDDITLKLPKQSGTLERLEATRTTLTAPDVDFSAVEIGSMTLTADWTLVITNPVQGKSALIEVNPNSFTLNFPSYVRILSGRFKIGTVNYVYLHCIDESVPTYLATIGQQQA